MREVSNDFFGLGCPTPVSMCHQIISERALENVTTPLRRWSLNEKWPTICERPFIVAWPSQCERILIGMQAVYKPIKPQTECVPRVDIQVPNNRTNATYTWIYLPDVTLIAVKASAMWLFSASIYGHSFFYWQTNSPDAIVNKARDKYRTTQTCAVHHLKIRHRPIL